MDLARGGRRRQAGKIGAAGGSVGGVRVVVKVLDQGVARKRRPSGRRDRDAWARRRRPRWGRRGDRGAVGRSVGLAIPRCCRRDAARRIGRCRCPHHRRPINRWGRPGDDERHGAAFVHGLPGRGQRAGHPAGRHPRIGSSRCRHLSPTRRNSALASAAVRPTIWGTATLTGVATIRVTVEPLSTSSPADGEVAITRPGPAVSLGSACCRHLSPTLVSAAPTTAAGWPTSGGTATPAGATPVGETPVGGTPVGGTIGGLGVGSPVGAMLGGPGVGNPASCGTAPAVVAPAGCSTAIKASPAAPAEAAASLYLEPNLVRNCRTSSERLERREHLVGVEAELVEAHVVEAEIGGRRVQRRQRPVAEQLFEARALEDAVRAAEGQRGAGDAARRFADDVFGAVERGRRLRASAPRYR